MTHPIYSCLEASVNLEILNILQKTKKDQSFDPQQELIEINEQGIIDPTTNKQITLSELFASHGDVLFYSEKKGKEQGLAGKMFALLTKVLALGAFTSGGISFGDLKWEIKK